MSAGMQGMERGEGGGEGAVLVSVSGSHSVAVVHSSPSSYWSNSSSDYDSEEGPQIEGVKRILTKKSKVKRVPLSSASASSSVQQPSLSSSSPPPPPPPPSSRSLPSRLLRVLLVRSLPRFRYWCKGLLSGSSVGLAVMGLGAAAEGEGGEGREGQQHDTAAPSIYGVSQEAAYHAGARGGAGVHSSSSAAPSSSSSSASQGPLSLPSFLPHLGPWEPAAPVINMVIATGVRRKERGTHICTHTYIHT